MMEFEKGEKIAPEEQENIPQKLSTKEISTKIEQESNPEMTEEKRRERARELMSGTIITLRSGDARGSENFPFIHEVAPSYTKEKEDNLFAAECIAAGDAHANVLKITEVAIASGLMAFESMDLQNEFLGTYKELMTKFIEIKPYLKELYDDHKDKDFTNKILNEIKNLVDILIEKIKKIQWTGDNRQLILLGDIIKDRGVSDRLTLSLFKHLREQGAETHVLASNHDLDIFFQFLANRETIGSSHHIDPASKEDYIEYIKQTQLLLYDEQNNICYSHAYLTGKTIQRIKAAVYFRERITPNNAEKFVERVNEWYQEQLNLMIDEFKRDQAIDARRWGGCNLIQHIVWGDGYLRDIHGKRRSAEESRQIINKDPAFGGEVRCVSAHDVTLNYVYKTVPAITLDDFHHKSPLEQIPEEFRLFTVNNVKFPPPPKPRITAIKSETLTGAPDSETKTMPPSSETWTKDFDLYE